MNVSDSLFLAGETIDLCIPTREDIECGGWFRWFNDPKTTEYLMLEGVYPNTVEAQTKRYESWVSDQTRLMCLIRPKGSDRPIGVVSLSQIDHRVRRADINLIKGVRTQDHNLYALEAMALMTEHGFERVGLRIIVGGQAWPGLRNWQQRLELLGYRCDGIMRKAWAKGYHEHDLAFVTCLLEDYRELKNVRNGQYWPGESRMRELIAELPKTSYGSLLEPMIRRSQKDYFAKLRESDQGRMLITGAGFVPDSNSTAEALSHWDRLYAQVRFRLQYPSESVVRFLVRSFPEEVRSATRILDIGAGVGRHVRLLCELGFRACGVDISGVAVSYCRASLASAGQSAELHQASMFQLPFADESLDGAISFAAFYYADAAGMRRAVSEMHRVLRPGAVAFVFSRTDSDYRCGKGTCLEPYTFRLESDDTNERGCVMHFLREEDIADMFRAFAEVRFEKNETTFDGRKGVNSDWLIEVRK